MIVLDYRMKIQSDIYCQLFGNNDGNSHAKYDAIYFEHIMIRLQNASNSMMALIESFEYRTLHRNLSC